MFYIDPRSAKSFLIGRDDGNVPDILDFLPSYNNFILKSATKQKIRLTPNIVNFIGGPGLEGPFAATLSSIASGLSEMSFPLKGYLQLYERDSIVINNHQKLCQRYQRPQTQPKTQPKTILDDEDLVYFKLFIESN